jgi:hypothetical protein
MLGVDCDEKRSEQKQRPTLAAEFPWIVEDFLGCIF